MKTIMTISLEDLDRSKSERKGDAKKAYSGCKLTIPKRSDSAPVASGTSASPMSAILTIQPIAPDSKCGGRNVPHWFMIIGNIGPRNRPTREIATAEGISFGTTHMNISRLKIIYQLSGRAIIGVLHAYLPYGYDPIDNDSSSFAYLWFAQWLLQ